MSYYEGCPELNTVLDKHKASANNILSDAQSQLLCDTFSENLAYLFSTSKSAGGDMLNVNIEDIKSAINTWKSEIDDCYESFLEKLRGKDKLTDEEQYKMIIMGNAVMEIKRIYGRLSEELDEVELKFQNTVRLYRSPIRSALADISMLYNSENKVKGDFSGFENVSVYVHGIEDTGKKFLDSAVEAAESGDVLIYVMRNGDIEYRTVSILKGEKIVKKVDDIEKLKQEKQYEMKKGRLHIIYDTEHKNEHRQETSDDLAQKLNEMGLINNSTKIDMFAHSYGGRRSLQFAVDYPDNVRSITTVGTPYDTNLLAKSANSARWIAEKIGQDPKNTSDYIDFNKENRNDIKGLEYSNAYTDMSSEPLSEDIHKLKSANPEVYDKLQKMEITAVAGYRKVVQYNPYARTTIETKTSSDDTVSIKSQHAEILGDLIDKRPQIEVKGNGVTDPGHIYEVEDKDFINIIEEVNEKQKNRSS
ncbi:alpha/beta fold hydrolase [Metabacillus fastidiosus]|uniref:alpha/beta fold hydrolase n=1 Tax=Metabacillus fastidiosus TaxID=1458 RepID=UPI002E21DED4|nr:alpha/beta fold hydrolase [Metabacillus fastidiosus]